MDVRAVLDRAKALLKQLPERQVGDATEGRYRDTFAVMERAGVFDPMAGTRSRNTYGVKRAALHFVARERLVREVGDLERLLRTRRVLESRRAGMELNLFLDAVEDAIVRHPAVREAPSFTTASPWQAKQGRELRRGSRSKKHSLKVLPRDWRERMWAALGDDSAYRSCLAVLCLSPARPGEFVPDIRDSSFARGVQVILTEGRLLLCTVPLKSHRGTYGTGPVGVVVDVARSGEPARYLAGLCIEAEDDGVPAAIEVSVDGADALRKAVERVGRRAGFPIAITPYTFRSQWIADAKATFGAGAAVAAGAGQGSARTQTHYGRVEHGRRGGLVDTFASRPPRSRAAETSRLNALKAERSAGRRPPPLDRL